MSTSQSEREKVFAKVRRLVREKHFNPSSHGVDWDELAAQSFGRIPSTKAALPWLIIKYGVGDKSICLYTEGLGPQKFHGKVVLLVNEHSASAAEMLAAFAAENNLAKIVGTKTAGRLLSGSAFRVGHGYILVLPSAAYLTWSGRSLEGTGITPDVEIDATYESLSAGEDVQLQKATEIVMQM